MKLRLRGPLERDVQAWILASLGVEQFELRPTKRGQRKVSLNVWLAPGCMFWRANSGVAYAPSGVPMRAGSPGMADIMGCVHGCPVALEVKREGGRQSANQRRWQQWAEGAGYLYAVVRSPSEAQAVVAGIVDGRQCSVWKQVLG